MTYTPHLAIKAVEPGGEIEPREGAEPRFKRWIAPTAAIVLSAGAIALLRHELQAYRYRDIARSIGAIPRESVGAALLLTVCGYLALPGYDALALRYVGRRLSAARIALASITAYAFSQTLGFSVVTGASIRFRFWSAWGLSASEIAQAVAFTTLSFWLGIIGIAGVVFVADPVTSASIPSLPFGSTRPIGVLFLMLIAAYVGWSIARPAPIRVGAWEFPSPPLKTVLAQIAVSALDWALAAAALYVLLPSATGLSLATFIGIYILGQTLGLISHVPGGLGVFESIVIILLRPYLPPAPVLAALVAYRAIYYLLPFAVAVAMLALHEAARKSEALRRVGAFAGQWVPSVVPHILTVTTFAAGVVLLFSVSTPSVQSRLRWLDDVFPLAVIELSHLVAALAGGGLIILARGIQRRLDAAYMLTICLLTVGIVASLLKGLDYEEGLVLTLVLAALLPARRHFYRKTAFLREPFTPWWVAAVILTIAGTVALGFFSYKQVRYTNAIWLRFSTTAEAARFLRASVGVVSAIAAFAFLRVMRPARVEPSLPSAGEIAKASEIVGRSGDIVANLALLGDKAFLFSDSGTALLMYGVEKRSWVALGDPIGPPEERTELAWRFREIVDQHGGWTVFYQVGKRDLPLYIDLGLTLLKLGENALVPLQSFSLEGGTRKGLRRTQRTVEKEGCSFAIISRECVPALLPELRRVSDTWMTEKKTREKGFSLGYFDEAYLIHFPVAVVRKDDRIVAFANIWRSGDACELSVDLMRYSSEAPSGVMEYLFIELMLWGRREGFEAFDLGMAPLSGFDSRQLAPLWQRMGAMVYRFGEHFYNFKGLRLYKEKFDPVWEPKYMASPGGLALPRILANVSSLISGGLRGVIAK